MYKVKRTFNCEHFVKIFLIFSGVKEAKSFINVEVYSYIMQRRCIVTKLRVLLARKK